MSEGANRQAKPLMSVISGGMTLTMLTMIVFGIVLLGVQAWIFTWPKEELPDSLWGIAPGIIGLTWIVLYAWFASRKGRIDIYSDRIEGKKTNGKAFQLMLSEVQAPNLLNRNLVLKDKSGKIRFLERLRHPNAAGMVWMLKTYEDFPLEMLVAEPKSAAQAAIRIYLDENGQHQALDNGNFWKIGADAWYFPSTQPLPIPNSGEEPNRIYAPKANPYLSLPQFEPSPALLPLVWWLDNLFASPMPEEERQAWLEKLAEQHGGCNLNAEELPSQAEFAGGMVEIRPLT